LFFALLIHVFFEEVEGSVSLLSFDGTTAALLFLEDGVEILVVSVVSTAANVAHRMLGVIDYWERLS
jgi:hypothetical protein